MLKCKSDYSCYWVPHSKVVLKNLPSKNEARCDDPSNRGNSASFSPVISSKSSCCTWFYTHEAKVFSWKTQDERDVKIPYFLTSSMQSQFAVWSWCAGQFVWEGFRCTVNLKHVDRLMLPSDTVNFQGTISEKVDRLIRWKCIPDFNWILNEWLFSSVIPCQM